MQLRAKSESSVSENDLLEELKRDFENTLIKPGETTYKMFSDYAGIPMDAAKYFLQAQFEAKLLLRRMITMDGKRTWAYSKSVNN